MILVDSSVWIDYFRGIESDHVRKLDELLGQEPLLIGDLILVEVLQGFSNQKAFNQARKLLAQLELVVLGGADIVIHAANHFRHLRTRGITTRKTIDTLIATRCIVDGYALLHHDRDFDAFEKYLGLKVVDYSSKSR